jgi:hypothetical protein
MEWQTWSNVDFHERQHLPSISGIYAVIDSSGFIWYVGQATDLKNRWSGRSHHRYAQFIRSHQKNHYKIYWKSIENVYLDEQERLYINLFQPELNFSKVKNYTPKQPAVEREIQRLLRVFTRPTLLFPEPRSLIGGQYTHSSDTCHIIVFTNINDYAIIRKSSNKQHHPRLRQQWGFVPSHCGQDETLYHANKIPSYTLHQYCFEFIDMTNFLDYVRRNPVITENHVTPIEIFGISMASLNSPDITDLSPVNEEFRRIDADGKQSLTDIDYWNYRKTLIQTIIQPIKSPC